MASSVRIDGSLPDPGDASTRGLIFSGDWGVDYEFAGAPLIRANQPHLLGAFGFPWPFDSDLEGALRGRAGFSQFLYLFKDGQYLRLIASTLQPDGPDIDTATSDTASSWGLPPDWTSFDAVLPGRGSKINFCYFYHDSQYVRFDWGANAASAPKSIGTEWHMLPPFDAHLDGVIAGQSDLTTRGFLFTRTRQIVNDDGAVVPLGTPGSKAVQTPGFARYDFTAGSNLGSVTAPLEVPARWPGLIPLLDAGPAIDMALSWCDVALAALASAATPALTAALSHHFMTGTPSTAELAQITNRMTKVRNRVASLPDRFQWTRNASFVAQTVPNTLTEIGDMFSTLHGPNGRAAVLIHEAVHFIFVVGDLVIDVPEFSGATINGQTFGIVGGRAYSAMSTTEAIANPSSYAAFAQEIFFGADTRFGNARRHE
jgi:hypothetical protein